MADVKSSDGCTWVGGIEVQDFGQRPNHVTNWVT